MIAETGLAALWLAAGLAAFQFLLMILTLKGAANAGRAMRSIAVLQGFLTLIAFAMLLIVFARSDMSVALVFENSSSVKPFIYKLAGAWGNHEGSMLMWVTILALAGAFLALLSHRTGERTLLAALGAQAVLALGFYAFLLIASNPFSRLWPPPVDGRGLNPLLQDPGGAAVDRDRVAGLLLEVGDDIEGRRFVGARRQQLEVGGRGAACGKGEQKDEQDAHGYPQAGMPMMNGINKRDHAHTRDHRHLHPRPRPVRGA